MDNNRQIKQAPNNSILMEAISIEDAKKLNYLEGVYNIEGVKMKVHCDQYHIHNFSCLIPIEETKPNGPLSWEDIAIQCRSEIAKKYGYRDWLKMSEALTNLEYEIRMEEFAEAYATSRVQVLEEELASTQINLSTVEEENKRLQERLSVADEIINISSPSDMLIDYQKDLELREKYNSLKK